MRKVFLFLKDKFAHIGLGCFVYFLAHCFIPLPEKGFGLASFAIVMVVAVALEAYEYGFRKANTFASFLVHDIESILDVAMAPVAWLICSAIKYAWIG